MIGASVRPDIDALVRVQEKFQKFAERRLLVESDRAATEAKDEIRDEMTRARLGRLGNAIGATSDLKKGNGVHRSGGKTTASGVVFIRSKSERTRGTIASYTEGGEILPRNSRWLWIATDDVPARAGRVKITPGNWSKFGLDQRIGPLVLVKSVNGWPLLVVKDASVSLSGKPRSAKSLTKTGKLRKGQTARSFIVAFYAIPRTSRQARLNPRAIASRAAQRMARRLQA